LTSQRVPSEHAELRQEVLANRRCCLTDRRPTILVVDDEEALRYILRVRLTARGYLIHEAGTGEVVLQTVPILRPDVIVLDIGLPDIDGIEVTRRLRPLVQTPIIILSVHATEADKIAALDAGADDYLTKPCDLGDLLDRIRTALLRVALQDERVFALGDLVVDLGRQMVRIGEDPIQLTASEYDLLRVLVLNAGRLLTQSRLAQDVWRERSDEDALQMLRTTINTLRQKLDTNPARPRFIVLEPGVGYRLRIAPSISPA
jgi:two-component system KDP operon response regulator KdpE